MAKVQINSEETYSFWRIFSVMEQLAIYHLSNIPAIFQAVTHILKKRIIYRF